MPDDSRKSTPAYNGGVGGGGGDRMASTTASRVLVQVHHRLIAEMMDKVCQTRCNATHAARLASVARLHCRKQRAGT